MKLSRDDLIVIESSLIVSVHLMRDNSEVSENLLNAVERTREKITEMKENFYDKQHERNR